MRREGYELLVSKPSVIIKYDENGNKLEPIENLIIDVPEEFTGVVMEKIGLRKGEMTNMETGKQGYVRLSFTIPARGLIGYRNEFMTDTKGNGIMNHMFKGYEAYKGEMSTRQKGVLIAFEKGVTNAYGLFNAQERGELFVGVGVQVYEGMVVGENPRQEDISINVCKEKHLTNMRASGSDEALKLTPPRIMSLEQAIEYINDDELVEVTPKNIRLRKKILDSKMRERAARKSE
jgi:GTP-binding protein